MMFRDIDPSKTRRHLTGRQRLALGGSAMALLAAAGCTSGGNANTSGNTPTSFGTTGSPTPGETAPMTTVASAPPLDCRMPLTSFARVSGDIYRSTDPVCAVVYNSNANSPDWGRAVGTLEPGQKFELLCDDGPKPPSLRVEVAGKEGDVNLDGSALFQETLLIDVKNCPVSSPMAAGMSATPTP